MQEPPPHYCLLKMFCTQERILVHWILLKHRHKNPRSLRPLLYRVTSHERHRLQGSSLAIFWAEWKEKGLSFIRHTPSPRDSGAAPLQRLYLTVGFRKPQNPPGGAGICSRWEKSQGRPPQPIAPSSSARESRKEKA